EVLSLDIRESNPVNSAGKPKWVNDPMADRQWGWQAIEGERVREWLQESGIRPARKALIAILDTGVEAGHEDLRAQFRSVNPAADADPVGHGTHCAGVAAAVTNNGVGIASLAGGTDFVEVTSIRVLNNFG